MSNPFYDLDIYDLSDSDLRKYEIVDVREAEEDRLNLLSSLLRRDVHHMPLSSFDPATVELESNKKYLFICQRGMRSAKLVEQLRDRGFTNAFSLSGGMESVRRKYIA